MKNKIITVFYGKKTIEIQKDSNFLELKKKIFFKDKQLIKFFSFGGEKIAETLMVYNYPNFLITMDKSQYIEFTKGKFRCKKCRKYLKVTKMICNHSSKCRMFYDFTLKESMSKEISGGYKEQILEFEEDEYDEEELNNEINLKVEQIIEKMKRNMIQKIKDLLYNKE